MPQEKNQTQKATVISSQAKEKLSTRLNQKSENRLINIHTLLATPGHKKMDNLGTLNEISDDKWYLMGIKWPQTKSDFLNPNPLQCSCCNYFVVLPSPGWQDPSVLSAPQTNLHCCWSTAAWWALHSSSLPDSWQREVCMSTWNSISREPSK